MESESLLKSHPTERMSVKRHLLFPCEILHIYIYIYIHIYVKNTFFSVYILYIYTFFKNGIILLILLCNLLWLFNKS